MFKVQWEHQSQEDITWESFTSFVKDAPEAVEEYLVPFFNAKGRFNTKLFLKEEKKPMDVGTNFPVPSMI